MMRSADQQLINDRVIVRRYSLTAFQSVTVLCLGLEGDRGNTARFEGCQ
jgi:hypothetical protein